MFQFTGYLPTWLCVHHVVTGYVAGRVPPFGDRRVFASLQLTAAFRSLARPSSVSSGKASSVRPSLLNQWFSFSRVFSRCFKENCYNCFGFILQLLRYRPFLLCLFF